nr:hydroxyethylthiazole kinase [uncultured Butyrivibrio sp.]
MSELIHCITNPISMMQCANAVLGMGDRPIMAEHPLEVKEITNTASALLINLGNISDSRMEAMRISFETALLKELPIVIDMVGIACSPLRREFAYELLGKISKKTECNARDNRTFILIKGNNAEIKALSDECYKGQGVDADIGLDFDDIVQASESLAKTFDALILCTGEKDIVTDGKNTAFVSNGTPMMSQITGTGCMLGAICACFLAKEKSLSSVIRATSFFGIAGEEASDRLQNRPGEYRFKNLADDYNKIGNGSFLISLLDAISLTDATAIDKKMKVEYKNKKN